MNRTEWRIRRFRRLSPGKRAVVIAVPVIILLGFTALAFFVLIKLHFIKIPRNDQTETIRKNDTAAEEAEEEVSWENMVEPLVEDDTTYNIPAEPWYGDAAETPAKEKEEEPEETDEQPTVDDGFSLPDWKAQHPAVRGIYVTGPIAGTSSMDELIKLVDETELNTMVIDIKNDNGELPFLLREGTPAQLGACVNYIRDMSELMQKLKEHDIYTIARIASFKDDKLAEARPELCLTDAGGKPVTDGNGIKWVNPCSEEVWEYLTEIAEISADAGFDEVQFDYVRFPVGDSADTADYGIELTDEDKHTYIQSFLSYASGRLHERGVPVTADLFGTVIGNPTDVLRVGQDYVELGSTVDAICPMLYPSHYGTGVFGFRVPDAKPYETIKAALALSSEELSAVNEDERAVVRPWLQAFTATWVDGHISYGGNEIRAQIQAVYDAGYEEWILWNAKNRYSADGLEPAAGDGD